MKKRFVLLVSLAALALASLGLTQAIGATGPNEGRSSAAVPGTAAGMPPTAQTLWAVVNANGSLARGFGVASSTRVAAGGSYQVVFTQNVAGCAYVATIGNAGIGAAASGEITTAARAGNANGVFVQSGNSAGARADRPFHLAVHC